VDEARLRFLFGVVPEPELYADEDGRADLIAADRADDSPLRVVIANQVLDDDPPGVWRAANRLLDAGFSRHDAMDQLVMAARPMITSAVTDDGSFGPDDYLATLDRLPLPTVADVTAQYIEAARAAVVGPVADLEQQVAERLGLTADDPLTEALLSDVDDALHADPHSRLVMLASDLVAYLPLLVDGAVLTHRLTASEQAAGRLDLRPDLAALTWIDEPRLGEIELDADPDHWYGPRDWLADLPVGGLLAVRATEDGDVTLEALPGSPAPSPRVVEALRACYDAQVAEPHLPVDGVELAAGMLQREPAVFAEPRAPLSELAEAAGLQERDGEFAHDASVWAHADDLHRLSRLMDRLGPAARAGMDAYALLTRDTDDPAALRDALDILEDPEILAAVVDALLEPEDPQRVRELVALADRLVTVAGRSLRGAVAAAVAAVAAERDGRPLDAESHLRTAARLGDGWDFVEDRLAWYASDRGDAAAALALWTAIGAPLDDPDVSVLRPFAAATTRELARNEPCWCGSGRKYKQCHRGQVERAPLPERVGWLARKSVAYLSRRGGTVADLVPYVVARHSDLDAAEFDPLVLDVALVEGGLFARFLADRGPLLPEDERLLAEAWTLVERTIYEVAAVDVGHGVALRDLRTGDRLDVRDRGLSRSAAVGQMLCARAVPDGTGQQIVGAPFSVAPGTERLLLPLLDAHDGVGLLEWVAGREAGPRLVSAEGDDLTLCTTVLTLPDGGAGALDAAFSRVDDGWVWSDGPRVLASMVLREDRLVATTLTERRMDDLLELLPGCTVVSETREPPDFDAPPSGAPAPLDPAVLDEVQEQMEQRWCDEPVPALDGLRPRDAVDDPTRRADVARLIASFPEIDPASGAFGLRPARLRELLGLG
jgi:SEC-C motif